MEYNVVTDCRNIDFNEVREVIEKAGLAARPAEIVQKAFANSYVSVFVFSGEKLVGVGRAISDGAYEAGVYDIAVLPEYQGKGLGKVIMDEIIGRLQGMNIILYAMPGVENFYRKLGFRKMLTGMAKFVYVDLMKNRGFTE
ncbi:MAG: GNAT family N-acetyltransferase [Peptococcaceae bacterium]|nr:GNAT family N-acetyltransferase [Peptococcaceae bacterium]